MNKSIKTKKAKAKTKYGLKVGRVTYQVKDMKKEIQLIEKLYKEGKIYIIDNSSEGCYQLAFKEGKEANPAEDPCWELDVEFYD